MNKRVRNSLIIVLAIIFLFVGWKLVSPLFLDNKVNEEIPLEDIQSSEMNNSELSGVIEGSFVDADSFHKTSGSVKVIESDGKRYIRFEDFEATNGPDLYVYLATDNGAEDYINLGKLKGNIGNQNYELPEGTDLEKYDSVLIWCRAFSVLFGSAELS